MTTGADWVDQARRLLEAFAQGRSTSPAEPDGAHRSDCSWCPVCQAAAIVRGERPEVTTALADVLTATAAALRTFAESAQPAEADLHQDDDPEAEPPSAVQRIEIA